MYHCFRLFLFAFQFFKFGYIKNFEEGRKFYDEIGIKILLIIIVISEKIAQKPLNKEECEKLWDYYEKTYKDLYQKYSLELKKLGPSIPEINYDLLNKNLIKIFEKINLNDYLKDNYKNMNIIEFYMNNFIKNDKKITNFINILINEDDNLILKINSKIESKQKILINIINNENSNIGT
jgi:hypothetical protein